ncbi:hypothetical protein [Celerinatantimonas yamalensis]|uniref:Uncharacterized protein n=1 Tax=Celerinatantimonas yamalensis TaxID=559956 RepID=A0ABW9G5S9_9GAMM
MYTIRDILRPLLELDFAAKARWIVALFACLEHEMDIAYYQKILLGIPAFMG